MQNKLIKICPALAIKFLTIIMASLVAAEEKIIQQEDISFDKCLDVIDTSQSKLSITPEIKNVTDQKRTAIFILTDGSLTITCDGVEGNVTVTTNVD